MIKYLSRRAVLGLFACSAAYPALAAPQESTHQVVSINLPDGRGYILAYSDKAKNPATIVVLHPEGSDPRKVYESSSFSEDAIAAGFAVLFPLGHAREDGGAYGWNLENCCLTDVSEIDFIDSVVSDAEMRYGLNGEKLFLVGEGAGGTLALQYATERPKALSAVAALDAQLNPEVHPVKAFVPVLLMQQEEDGLLPLFARFANVPLIAYEGAYYDAEGHVHLWHMKSNATWQNSQAILGFFLTQT